jgi:hypothetical protein
VYLVNDDDNNKTNRLFIPSRSKIHSDQDRNNLNASGTISRLMLGAWEQLCSSESTARFGKVKRTGQHSLKTLFAGHWQLKPELSRFV